MMSYPTLCDWFRFDRPVGYLLVVAVLSAGCGRAEYERRVSANVTAMRTGAMYAEVFASPSPIPGTPLQLRLPKFINETAKAFNEESPDPSGTGKIDSKIVQPPNLTLPGLRVCYQMINTADGMPYYWYLAAVPATDPLPEGKPFEKYAMDHLKAVLQDGSVPESDVAQCPAPGNQLVSWQRVKLQRIQTFQKPGGGEQGAAADFQLLIGEVNGWRVFVAFLAPTNVSGPLKMASVIPTVAGTVSLVGAPADAAAAPAAPAAQ